jgi:hypothetical protein
VKSRISGKDATTIAREALKRRPIPLLASEGVEQPPGALVPSDGLEQERKTPPRVRKPSPLNDQCVAPTPDLESHRKRLREAFGNTMSDEFVDVLLGKLAEALRPGPFDALEEATMNAALAIIHSMQPQSELQALLAVQIIATGFSGLRLLRQSQQQMTEDFIDVYGNYAIKLLRLQNDMIQTFDRYRRGNKQTVEVRHVHIHSGGQGVVGIINPPDDREGGGPRMTACSTKQRWRMTPNSSALECKPAVAFGRAPDHITGYMAPHNSRAYAMLGPPLVLVPLCVNITGATETIVNP